MSAAALLADLPIWRSRVDVRPLAAGRTNQNFLIIDQGHRYFARVGQEIPAHGISRAAEIICHSLAAEAGIAPPLTYTEGGVLVMEYVDGATLTLEDAARSVDLPDLVAALLHRLHAIGARDDLPGFCPVTASERYLEHLGDVELPMPRQKLIGCLTSLPREKPRCLVHGDLIPENFIQTRDKLVLIDWEYAGNGLPESDLALAITNFGWDARTADRFLCAYGAVDRRKIEAYKVAALMREALWCLMQARIGVVAPDLPAYTDLCLDRLRQAIA